MIKFLSGISLFLMSLLAYAADEPGPVDTTVSASDEIGIVIFALIFFGLIVGYFFYLYWGKERKNSDKANKSNKE